jgi:hypothetical protein
VLTLGDIEDEVVCIDEAVIDVLAVDDEDLVLDTGDGAVKNWIPMTVAATRITRARIFANTLEIERFLLDINQASLFLVVSQGRQ